MVAELENEEETETEKETDESVANRTDEKGNQGRLLGQ